MSQILERLGAGRDVPPMVLEELTRGRQLLRQREGEEAQRKDDAWKRLMEQAQLDLGVLWDCARLARRFERLRTNEFVIQLPRWRAVLRVRYAPCSGQATGWLQVNFGTRSDQCWAVCHSVTAPESAWEYALDRCEALARAERLEVPSSAHWPVPEGHR